MRYSSLSIVLAVLMTSCGGSIKKLQLSNLDDAEALELVVRQSVDQNYDSTCKEALSYAPDANYPLEYYKQTIRMNAHFMDADSAQYNFEREEGDPYFGRMMRNAIMRLRDNEQMALPEGNNTPKLVANYDYQLVDMDTEDGRHPIAYHLDDELYWYLSKGKNKNNYKKEVINKYKQDSESVLNVFMLPTHPDSVASPTYRTVIAGIALGTCVKMTGIYEMGGEAWQHATNLNHEVGHVLGLSHAWYRNDGCDDTPRHSNCWHNSGKAPCDGPASNNMMDYNASQMAITPCQLGKIHRNFHKLESKQRKLLVPKWCEHDDTADIIIDEDREWLGAKDLKNDVIVKSGSTLTIHCRVSMAGGSKIVVEPDAKLVLLYSRLHNDCGDTWQGIEVQSKGKATGIVEMQGDCSIENVATD